MLPPEIHSEMKEEAAKLETVTVVSTDSSSILAIVSHVCSDGQRSSPGNAEIPQRRTNEMGTKRIDRSWQRTSYRKVLNPTFSSDVSVWQKELLVW